jgi:hypothetical protein
MPVVDWSNQGSCADYILVKTGVMCQLSTGQISPAHIDSDDKAGLIIHCRTTWLLLSVGGWRLLPARLSLSVGGWRDEI